VSAAPETRYQSEPSHGFLSTPLSTLLGIAGLLRLQQEGVLVWG
jgi:hypothetical protein